MYYEAKRRQLKDLKNKELYENEKLKEELKHKHAWIQSLKKSYNFSIEINDNEIKQFKSRSKSKDNFFSIESKSKSGNKNLPKNSSRLTKTEINNRRFDNNSENKRFLQDNSIKHNSLPIAIKQKNLGVYEKIEDKSHYKNQGISYFLFIYLIFIL